jgi:NitT/TauT family transport system substrate-binding protein
MRRRSLIGSALAATIAGRLAGEAEAQELSPITAACAAIEPHAEGYYAADQGIFRKHGLNVTVQTMSNGAAIGAAVVGGSVQFGVSNTLQIAQAHARNIPFKIVALGAMTDERFPTSGLLVSKSAGIANGKDLNGKTIGVATLRSLDQLAACILVDKQGGDSKTLQFVELIAPSALEALLQGRVAAITLEPPQLQIALANSNVHSIGDLESAIAPRWVTTNWFAEAGYLNEHPDIARRFAAAIYEAGQWAVANRAASAAVLSKILNTTTTQTYDRYATKSDPALLQSVLAVASRYGFVAPTNASDLLWSA